MKMDTFIFNNSPAIYDFRPSMASMSGLCV